MKIPITPKEGYIFLVKFILALIAFGLFVEYIFPFLLELQKYHHKYIYQ